MVKIPKGKIESYGRLASLLLFCVFSGGTLTWIKILIFIIFSLLLDFIYAKLMI